MLYRNYKRDFIQDLADEAIRKRKFGIDPLELSVTSKVHQTQHLLLPGNVECTAYRSSAAVVALGGRIAVSCYVVNDGKAEPVLITDYLYDKLPKDARWFVRAHEAGHLVNGDLGTAENAIREVASGASPETISDTRSEWAENRADDYAVRFLGRRRALRAMKEIQRMIRENPWTDFDLDELQGRMDRIRHVS